MTIDFYSMTQFFFIAKFALCMCCPGCFKTLIGRSNRIILFNDFELNIVQ